MVGESLFRTGANKFSSLAEFHIAQFSGCPLLRVPGQGHFDNNEQYTVAIGLSVEIQYRIHKTNVISLLLQRSMMADSNVTLPEFRNLEFDTSSSGMEIPLIMAGSIALAFDTSLMLLSSTELIRFGFQRGV